MVNINKYIKPLLHPAGGHQGSHEAHQAGNQSPTGDQMINSIVIKDTIAITHDWIPSALLQDFISFPILLF